MLTFRANAGTTSTVYAGNVMLNETGNGFTSNFATMIYPTAATSSAKSISG